MRRALGSFATVVMFIVASGNCLPAAGAESQLVLSQIGPMQVGPSTQAENRIKAALEENTDFDFAEMPLSDVANYISDRHKIPVQFDFSALKDAGIEASKLNITRNLKGVHLRSALDLTLSEHSLTWVIHDEVMLITTQDKANNMLDTRVYDVHDLVENEDGKPDFDSLDAVLRSAIGPVTLWDCNGGQGTIEHFKNGESRGLIIYQTQKAHEDIERLLTDLRKLDSPSPK